MRRLAVLAAVLAAGGLVACGILVGSDDEEPAPTVDVGDAALDAPAPDPRDGSDPIVDAAVDVDAGADADAAPPVPRVLLTRRGFTGAIGGLAQADALCQADAIDAGLGGTWTAWLSDSNVDARDRIGEGPYVNLADASVTSRTRILTGQPPAAAILPYGAGAPVGEGVWTGTLAQGIRSGTCCGDWKADAGSGATVGRTNDLTATWTNCPSGTGGCPGPQTCDSVFRLICFEK